MATCANFILHVVLSDTFVVFFNKIIVSYRKLRLQEKPGTVEQLNEAVRIALKIEYPFVILYEDSELNNALCTLESTDDVEGFGTVRIVEIKVVEGGGQPACSTINFMLQF